MKCKIAFSIFWLIFVSLFWIPSLAYSWEKCSWYNIGYNKTHFSNQGDWCPYGMFITQIDLDGGGYGDNNMGNYPIVGKVKCCKPTGSRGYLPIKRTPRGGGKADSASVTREDIRLIWQQIDEILRTLEGQQ